MRLQARRRRLRHQVLDEEEVGRLGRRARPLPARAGLAGAFAALALASCSREAPAPQAIELPSPVAAPTATTASLAAPRPSAETAPRPGEGVAWSTDLDAAWARALSERRALFVYVRAGWSAPALEMEGDALLAPEVERASRPYVALYLDLTSDDVVARAQSKLGTSLDRIPTVALIDPRTRKSEVVKGAMAAGELADLLAAFVTSR